MKKSILIMICVILLIALLAWSPWITKDYVEKKVLKEWGLKNYGIIDGCGSWDETTNGLAIPEKVISNKILFGYNVELNYYCGFGPGPGKEPPEIEVYHVWPFGFMTSYRVFID